MIKRSFTFGENGLEDMIRYLEKLDQSVKRYPKEVVQKCSLKAEQSIDAKLNTLDLDDNARGSVVTVSDYSDNHAKSKISHIGTDVAFLEFGTGMIGKHSPHPLSPQYNWQYYIDTIYKRTSSKTGLQGWFHNKKFHVGIPAGRAVYNASKDVKKDIKRISKEVIRSAINSR